MVYPIGKRIVFPIVRLWIKYINGLENIPKKGSFIIAANHTSYMDHFFMGYVIVPNLNKKLHFLAKKEHFKGLDEGKIIGIYPEGTRSLTGKLQRAKTGVARLALLSGVPVIPVGLIGTFEILPKGKYMPKLRKAAMNIGKPMHFDEYYNKNINKKILREITTKIMKNIAKLCKQKYDY